MFNLLSIGAPIRIVCLAVAGIVATGTAASAQLTADLAITKTDGVTAVTAGGSVTYTITASNAGPDAVTGGTVADTFPASLTATWTCVGAGGGTCTASGSGNIADSINLPVGGSVTYTASATISPAATGTLTNTATVSGGAASDPNPANNSATDTDTLGRSADLAVTKTDGVTTLTPGGSVTYTITVSNAGPSNATGTTVADTFPASLTATWTCVGAGGGTCTASGSGNIADTVNLPAGGSVTYTASATISPAATGTLSNTATVSAGAGVTDPTPGNNSATDTDTLNRVADLAITKTDGVTSATAGGSVTYTITASNAGLSNVIGATVADTFPASLTATWTCVGAGGGTCTASGSGNIADTVNLPAGGSVTYVASATINPAASGTLSNTATVSAPAGVSDPTPGNNSATDTDTLTVTITPTHDIQGPGASSPFVGSTVTTRGIVTGRTSSGFFVQESDALVDADPATSEGVFVFTSGAPPAQAAVGALVHVTGTIAEFVPGDDPLAPPSTRLTSPTVVQISTGNPLPAPVPLTPTFPDPAGPFDQLERVEHMRVSVASLTVSGPSQGSIDESNATGTNNGRFHGAVTGVARPFREAGIQAPDPPPTGSIPPIPRWDFNAERIRIESAGLTGQPALIVRSGDVVGPIVGPLDYQSRAYGINPDGSSAPAITPGTLTTTVAAAAGNEVTIASFNLQRFFDAVDDPSIGEPVLTPQAYDTRLAKASIAIRQHLRHPDIIAVQDVENLTVLQDLATAVNTASGPQYAAHLVEGNAGTGLDVGFLVKVDDLSGGPPRVAVGAVTQANDQELFVNPDSSTQALWEQPPLVLEATINRAAGVALPIVVVGAQLHTAQDVDSIQPGTAGWATEGARARAIRQEQAESLANLVQARQTADPAERLVLVGGFEALAVNDGLVDVVNVIAGTPAPDNETVVPGDGVDLVNPDLLNLASTALAAQRYSNVADGNAQAIDHVLVSAGLVAGTTARRIEYARIGADYPETERNDATSALRTSDHDPVVAYLAADGLLVADPGVTVTDAPDPVTSGTTLTYTITAGNTGPDAAANVSLSDTLPAGTTFVSLAAPAGWSCSTPAVGAGGTMTCSTPSLNVGSGVFTLTVAVAPTVASGTVLSNTASISASTPDPDPADNAATATTTVDGAPTPPAPQTYVLAEGATGAFFDEDLLIANPNGTDAPVTLTFYVEGGATVTETRTIPARSGATVRVDALPGLAEASASVQVSSDGGLPLAVERTQFWGAAAYGGHTESAIPGPATRWFFAEGAQGYFDTFVMIANPLAAPVDVTLTFLREGIASVTRTVQVAPFARRTIAAAGIPELANRTFSIVVDATQPVVAERAMYFGSTATRLWTGGSAAAGVTAPSPTWYFAEGATGSFFDTFLLLMNPEAVDAQVTLHYLLQTGETIDVAKVVPARGRLTVEIEGESDARLRAGSMATLVTSDRPIVAERSMYWPTAESPHPWGESHTSHGAPAAASRWALAEGRMGGPLDFRTYVLLANPGTQPAEVTVQFLADAGAPVVRTYGVPAMGRFTVDVSAQAPELQDRSFITLIETAGGVPIVVERSMYWNGAGLTWSGGSNAGATRLPE